MSPHPYSLIIHEIVRNVKFFDERARNMVLFPRPSHIKALADLRSGEARSSINAVKHITPATP